MNDLHVADIGDFGKYGLLKALHGTQDMQPKFRLGVIWYHTRIRVGIDPRMWWYLHKSPQHDDDFRTCDPELYNTLQSIGYDQETNSPISSTVEEIEASGILPSSTVFFNKRYDLLPNGNRSCYFLRALYQVRRAERNGPVDLVFLDPDNGLREDADATSLHASWEDVRRWWKVGKSLAIYQEFHRKKGSQQAQQVKDITQEFVDRLSLTDGSQPIGLRWSAFHARAFIIVPQAEHRAALQERIRQHVRSPWQRHIEEI